MAVASLALQLTDFQAAVAVELFAANADYDDLETAEQAEIDRLILRAERTLWLHPPVDPPHVWSCLHDPGILDLWPDVAVDSDVTVSQSSGTMTATAATFYETMIGKSIVVTGEGTFVVTGYTSSTVVTVTPTDTYSAKTFSIASDGTYRLPTDFESPESSTLQFLSESGVEDIQLMNKKEVDRMRAFDTSTGYPRFAYVQWATMDGTAAHQQELVTWPEPAAYYQVALPYAVQPTGMSTANPYPRGGAEMADLLLSACLAICEEVKNGDRGARWEEFRDKCRVAVRRDKSRHHNFIAGVMRPHGAETRRGFDVKSLIEEASV